MRVPARGRREAGMTLIELLTVVAIVGILAAIAYPSYTRFVMQTNRTDATKTMQLAAQSLERCYSANFKYAPPGGCNVLGTLMNLGNANPPLQTPNNYYTITVTIGDQQDYTITAAATAAPQSSDSQCKSFTLASSGQQAALDSNNNDNTKLCWGSN
jgi:type IV pilus assembly protein PilE